MKDTTKGHLGAGFVASSCRESQIGTELGPEQVFAGFSEPPQQRFETHGVGALSDAELLALAAGNGAHARSWEELAVRIIAQAGSVSRLASWQPADFQEVKGVGRARARQLAALVEVGRRIMKMPLPEAPHLTRAESVAAYLAPIARGLEVEKFWVLCLNRKNRLRKLVEISSGTATATLVHPREVYRTAIQYGATAIVCAHNHPSGDPAPSAADLNLTRQLREAGHAIDIEMLDHVIVGETTRDPQNLGYYSIRSAGTL